MAMFVCLGTLAAFGLFSVFWCLFGWLLPKTGGVMLCLDEPDVHSLARRYLWLRGLGAISCPLIVMDRRLTAAERTWLTSHGIEICGPADIAARLGIGAEDIDGTGNGDPPGRHQRRGISEL